MAVMDIDTIVKNNIKFPECVCEDDRLISVIVENPRVTIALSGDLDRRMSKMVKNKLALVISDLIRVEEEYRKCL